MPEGLEQRYQYYTCAQIDKIRLSGFRHGLLTLEEAIHDYVTNYLLQDQRGESDL